MLKALIKLLIFLKPRGSSTVEDIKKFPYQTVLLL